MGAIGGAWHLVDWPPARAGGGETMGQNLKLVIAYEGTSYHGWQIQPGMPTIQGTLEERLATVLREPVRLSGAARTDAGVHALGQVATLAITGAAEPRRLHRSINALLPEDVAVCRVEEVPAAFHARHSAIGRIYRYQITEGAWVPPFLRSYAAHALRPLDVEAMDEAARLLIGRADFSSFRASGDVSESPVKEIRASRVRREEGCIGLVTYTVEASSFLQHMVRNIVGTLIEVGRGRLHPSAIRGIVDARDRRAAGPTAPARGLFLMKVLYAEPADLAPHEIG
jgi:tRNA pseudouridine38-40 synthase